MRKFLSLMTAILFAGSMMAADYVLTPLANVQSTDEVIIVGTQTVSGHEGTYAMSNDKGTSAAPAAVAVTVSNNKITTDATNILWNISVSDGSYTIRPNGDATNALYCTSTNNGVRVGTNANNAFVMDESGYFKNSATSRFVGLYQKQDWRCYTSLNANLANGGQSFAFYVKETEQGGQGGDDPQPTTYNLYLKSGSVNYAADNAVVAMWAWETNKEGAWYTFQPTETAGVYYVTLPLAVNNGKIMRWAEGTTPSWDVEGSAWNKTGDIAFPSTVPATTDMIELTAWNDATTGTWTKYVAPTYTDVYFVNKDNWTAVNVYGWDANGNNGWPGVAMTKTANKLFGLDVYKAQINDTFTKVIFNDGTNQTEDLDFVVAKPYFFDGIWYATLAEIPANCAVINAAANGTTITLKAGAVVVYAEGKYAYIKDDSGVAMIYASGSNHGLETGDTITANIAGSISVYKNLPEFVATTFPIEAKKTGEAPIIADATEEPKAENLNQVVVYKNVTFASSEYSSKAITGTWGDKEIKFYDQWNKTLVFDTEKIYNVTAASGVYNTNYQAYIIAAEPVCQDGPYALLVNGTTVIPAKMEAKEGYNEYAMYASLVKGDSVQVLNTSCGGLWIPTLEEAGAADHFAKGLAAATVDSTGCYDFYFKQIPNDQKMYIGFGICADDTIRYTVRGKGGILGEDFENAFDSKEDTLNLALTAGKYELKVVVGEDWKGFEQLTDTATGLKVGDQGNICFELNEAGAVSIVYNDSVFKLIGNFYVAPIKYYIAGSMTKWAEEMVELLPLEEKADSLGIAINLEADSLYAFKVVRVQGTDTAWYGLGEAATMEYGNSEGWWIFKSENDQNQANVGLMTTKAAEYPFVVKVAEDHLEVSVAIPAPTPTAAVTGSMNNWEGQIPFELAEDEKTATLFVDNMKSGEYDFRMIIGGQERSNGWWFKRDVLGAAGITGNDGNAMKLIADVDGDYTITWFFANDSIHFEFPAPAMFYVTGDSALVKDAAGLEKKDEWKAKAIKAEQDTLVLSLKADQEYKLKLIEDGNWEGGKVYGYDALTQEDKAGLSADNDNNIVFKLNEDGDVKVVYFWEEDTENEEWKMTFKLIGDFYVEPEIPHTYTVVGPSLPNKWDQTSTASDMTLVEGVYTYVLADVELKAGAHEYKIVEDHAWDVAFPQNGNASFSVEKDGIYDVTFTLDKETKAYTAVPELKQEIIIAPTAVLMGLAEVEPWTVGEAMEVAEGFKTASITKHFVPSKAEGDTLKFKVVINDAWRSNAYLYHRGFVGAAGITMNIEGDDCDMKVVVDVEGDYTFTWTFENDSIGITFPEKPEPVMDDGYYIIGLNGWNVADLTADDMFWSTGIETNEFSINLTLRLNDEFKVVRVVDDMIQEWYPAEGDNYVVDDHHYGATTVYFRPNYNGNEDWFAGCIYVLPTSTVDIDILDTNAPAVKILRDGQILIIKGNKTFNIQGQLVR